MPRKTERFGWVPDLPDQRDHMFAAPMAQLGPLPAATDLRAKCPPVYDQGQLSSCTANAISAAIQFDRMKQKLPNFMPSRLFIYFNERAMEGTVKSDSGAQIRDGIQTLSQLRGCLASGYPFVFGFTVYDGFESPAVAKSGHASLPASTEKVVGGHAVMAVGYDDAHQRFVVRNSWGPAWGMKGYFTLPYAYVTQASLASDFWTVRLVGK